MLAVAGVAIVATGVLLNGVAGIKYGAEIGLLAAFVVIAVGAFMNARKARASTEVGKA